MKSEKKRHTMKAVLAAIIVTSMLAAIPAVSAVPTKVICVPWQGDTTKHHETWDGQQVILKGVVHTDNTDPIWYKWNFGDATESAIFSLIGKTEYNVEVTHTYTGADETPFTAKLIVADNNALADTIEDPYLVKIQAESLDSKINVAIDNGLWHLYKSGYTSNSNYHTFDGSPYMVWGYSYYFAAPTASAVHAFEINGHKETGDPDEDPYVEAVKGGLNWLFNGYYSTTSCPMLRPYSISTTPLGDDPDTNGNGIGIEVYDRYYRPVYEGGMVMDAIIASGTPDADSGRDFDGNGVTETYQEVVQDMCDMYAWGQDGSGSDAGGWRCIWNSDSDNSACHWAAIGLIPAQEQPWNCDVPQWVKTYNNNWLNYSYQSWISGGVEYGGFGYTGPGSGTDITPSGMVQLDFCGATTSDYRRVHCERWLADNWKDVGSDWLDQNNVYAYYAFAKAMRLSKPNATVTFSSNNFDWYRGDGITMGLAEKISDQLVASSSWDYYGPNLGTAWCVIILKPVLFTEAPVACFDVDPNPSYPDMPISFDPSGSGHSEAGKDINNLTLFEWDWDDDGVYDESTTVPDVVTHSFSCPAIPCTYPVTLRVTDDNTSARTATYVMNILITNPPHPPVARTNGPYMVSLCSDDTLTFDGSGSYDPNEGEHEEGCSTCPDDAITARDWDLTGAPWDYTDESGEVIVFNHAGYSAYFSTGTHDISLRVTDNTNTSYPTSGEPDLTDEDFTVVEVYDGCNCELSVVVGCHYATLLWDDIGADSYTIYKSSEGVNTGFEGTAPTTETSKAMGCVVTGATTYYRVMAITGTDKCLSEAVVVYADPELCKPTADIGGPYEGCVDKPVTLDGSGSTAHVGTIVAWDWDLDSDGQYDDAFGETVQWTWDSTGAFNIGLNVTTSDSLTLTDESSTTVEIEVCGVGGVIVESADSSGATKDVFRTGDLVHTIGSGYAASTTYDLYVVEDRTWTDGMAIPPRVGGTKSSVNTDGSGNIPAGTLIWTSAVKGEYDIVVDVDGNGRYDTYKDGVDSGSPGFVVTPDTPPTPVPVLAPIGIIALIGLLCVIGVSRIRRRFN